MALINTRHAFVARPNIGEHYYHTRGAKEIVAATWQYGVVFIGGKVVSAREFISSYQQTKQ